MEHDARSIANELIRLAHNANQPITPMQVQKLTYFCHAWMLALFGRPLMEQPIEAWRHGPVVPDVYRSLRRYGGEPVRRLISGFPDDEFDEQETHIINQVFEKYGVFSGSQLSALTHAKDTPWDKIWEKYGQNAVIPDPIIEDYYAQMAATAR